MKSRRDLMTHFLLVGLQLQDTAPSASLPNGPAPVGATRMLGGFPSGSAVTNLPTMQSTREMWVGSLGLEDPPEKGMATHSGILAWEIPWTEEPGRLQSMGSQSWT